MDDLLAGARRLIDDYLADQGCPCRYPRFRAVAGRDTQASAGTPTKGDDQLALIQAFEERAPLGPRQALGPNATPLPQMWWAECERCKSRVERSSYEAAPSAWVDLLMFRRPAGLTDLGARVEHGRVLRCRPLVTLGRGGSLQQAYKLYPFVSEDEWFEWLRTPAPTG